MAVCVCVRVHEYKCFQQMLHDINWSALNHASRAPQLISCNYYYACVGVCGICVALSQATPAFSILHAEMGRAWYVKLRV